MSFEGVLYKFGLIDWLIQSSVEPLVPHLFYHNAAKLTKLILLCYDKHLIFTNKNFTTQKEQYRESDNSQPTPNSIHNASVTRWTAYSYELM